MSGKVIAKGPKVGHLFPIQFSIPSINSCAYSTVINNPHFWLKKLGHPNSNVSFPSHGSRASKCFEIIYTDVWGVSPVISHAQYKYFVTFIDDFSRFT